MKFNLFDYSPPVRAWLLLILYSLELMASLWFAYELRFDFMVETAAQQERLFVLCWLVPLQIGLLAMFHQLNPLLGYFSTPDLARMFHSLAIAAIVALVAWFIWGSGYAPPRGVIVVDFVFALVGLTGVRLAMRTMRETLTAPKGGETNRRRRVGIIGAGDCGAVLAHELSLKPGYGLQPTAFFDDDRRKWHSRVHDIPVLGSPEKLLNPEIREEIQEVIIAMPSAPAHRVGDLVRILKEARLPCKIVPSLDQLALGQVKVSQLRNVEIEDLLGREKVELEIENIRQILAGHVVLVSGAGGSIGSELCRQIASYEPKLLLLVERSEPQLFQIEQELIALGHRSRIVSLVANILDRDRMDAIFARYLPEVVFHAAAHKHVPMMESQPGEALQNNSHGTAQLADLALEHGVDRFVLISTDKAINPTSVMGATKRLAEMYVQGLSAANPEGTKFICVRFGNVLGSSGSVIPVFRKQIAEGGPVKVTHPDMTRYFMTIPEAVMLVLQSAMQGSGGEIFVLDMGKPVRIVDLARQMIELSGLEPDVDVRIEFMGIRPGEKLYEEITHKGENFVPTSHAKIFRFLAKPVNIPEFRKSLQDLEGQTNLAEPAELKKMFKKLIPDYTPFFPAPDSETPAITRLSDYRNLSKPRATSI
ncbi:MAG TPA: nucleoside-diphosphate sugar epimerase/dehydratase [Clostridia bacterium]|nr:nucleoside-diphosphate sugar epimerase/dehydratase [Clostridia bacterium]